MTSKERVKRAIHFQSPDRIPSHLPDPWPNDIVWIFPEKQDIRTEIRNGKQYRLSEWGSWWHVVSEQNMGEVVEPAIGAWDQLSAYRFPDVNAPQRYAHAEATIAADPDKYVMGVLSASLFPVYWELRGLMGFFEDLLEEPDLMEALLDQIVAVQLESVRQWSRYPIDGIVVGFDDWGLQDRLMIHPDQFRRYFLPRYRKVWQAIHDLNLDVILHSCGDITSILPDLIDAGLDVINMDQQENMGLERLGHAFAGKVCFWNPVDIQTVMRTGSPGDIAAYVRHMIRTLGTAEGGFIGKHYPQPQAAGHSDISQRAAFDAFVRFA